MADLGQEVPRILWRKKSIKLMLPGSEGGGRGDGRIKVRFAGSRGRPMLPDFPEPLPKDLQQDNGFFVCMDFRGLLLSNWQRSEPSF